MLLSYKIMILEIQLIDEKYWKRKYKKNKIEHINVDLLPVKYIVIIANKLINKFLPIPLLNST